MLLLHSLETEATNALIYSDLRDRECIRLMEHMQLHDGLSSNVRCELIVQACANARICYLSFARSITK